MTNNRQFYENYEYFISHVLEQKLKKGEVESEWVIAFILSTAHKNISVNFRKLIPKYLPEIDILSVENINELVGEYNKKKVTLHYDQLNKSELIFANVQYSRDYNPDSFKSVIENLSTAIISNKKIVW